VWIALALESLSANYCGGAQTKVFGLKQARRFVADEGVGHCIHLMTAAGVRLSQTLVHGEWLAR
jgi:hypothetical protein